MRGAEVEVEVEVMCLSFSGNNGFSAFWSCSCIPGKKVLIPT